VPRVTFQPEDRSAQVSPGTSLLDAAHEAGVELPSNCGGVCACTTCHVWVEAGLASLSGIGEREDDKLQEAAGFSAQSRLACQARVGAEDVVVRVPGNRIKA
jgi:2Fe-2S ferredoxin